MLLLKCLDYNILVCDMAISTYSDLLNFKEKLVSWIEKIIDDNNHEDIYTLFMSYGGLNQRCKVWSTTDNKITSISKRLLSLVDKVYKDDKDLLGLVKIDLVSNIEKTTLEKLKSDVFEQRHNNQYRKGVSLDGKFNICFLEQELYAYSIVNFKKSEVRNGITFNENNYIDEEMLLKAIKKKYKIEYKLKFNNQNPVWIFDTISCFYENNDFIDLASGGQENGMRLYGLNKKNHINELVKNNAYYLYKQIKSDGELNYGYFPVYDRKINNYNIVRHCTALYSLLETFDIQYQDSYLDSIRLSIDYVINGFYVEKNETDSFIIDKIRESEYEIKLGANAAAILMLTKYQEITGDNKFEIYAVKLANGILNCMLNQDNKFIHVLNYPDFKLKDKFRIIYYDGEAVFSLMRLYKITRSKNLLKVIELIVDNFVIEEYQKYHDHWLSYCINELTEELPKVEYFKLGIENYTKHFKFLIERKTVNATFLEMLMAAYKMVSRVNDKELLEKAELEKLKSLIEFRSSYQLTGYFYPEVAMYMKSPKTILHSFYSRPDRFRVRIDDQEHNLSGFISYLRHFEI